jgi:hypothetical protein
VPPTPAIGIGPIRLTQHPPAQGPFLNTGPAEWPPSRPRRTGRYFKVVSDSSNLDPTLAAEVRESCSQFLQPDADVYWRAVDVVNILGRALPNTDRLYVIWAALTDIWELEPDRRPEAEELMRGAAQEFVALADDEQRSYLARWNERLRISH